MNSARCSLGCYKQQVGVISHQGINANFAQPSRIITGVWDLWTERFLNVVCGRGSGRQCRPARVIRTDGQETAGEVLPMVWIANVMNGERRGLVLNGDFSPYLCHCADPFMP
jgi:hypothetical protein